MAFAGKGPSKDSHQVELSAHPLRHAHVFAVLALICLVQQTHGQGAFLQQQLPLKVLVSAPTALRGSDLPAAPAVTLTGRQALTAVFSRPVIALGSDWGSKDLPDSLRPFTLSCSVPGRLRWVTTNIARFDPSVDWPTDLACTFKWNTELKTYDGAPLVLDDLSPSVRLATQPLSISIRAINSEAASNATDDLWSATVGLPDDDLPEVPPDANITLSFSYPVDLAMLAKALTVAGPGSAAREVIVKPCPAQPTPQPIVLTANGLQGTPAGADASDILQLNSTCAVVQIVPGLAPGTSAVLRLPAGSRYSSIAGPVVLDTDVQVFGLRPFRIPLSWQFMNITNLSQPVYNSVKYRRLTLWLPHGLAENTKLDSIKPLLKICSVTSPLSANSACQQQDFSLIRPTLGTLVMDVPALAPRQRYRVTVAASPMIKDAFGLPLRASANVWWTEELADAYQGPSLNQVALLEEDGSKLAWPWVSRGRLESGVNRVQAWDIPVPSTSGNSSSNGDWLAQTIAGMSYSYTGIASDAFGPAGQTVSRSTSTEPIIQALELPEGPGVSLVASCCRQVSYPTNRAVFSSNLLVVRSDLQAAFVQQGEGNVIAWVTSAKGSSKPVVGAKVQVYLSSYMQDLASQGPSCTTSSDGTCTLNLSGADETENKVKSALVTAAGYGPLIIPSLSTYYIRNTADTKYSGVVVLDRQVVKPGDDLHVVAYFQRQAGTKLELAKDVTSVVLQITPPFNPSTPGGSTRITAPVDTTFGSAHAVIPIPANAVAATYSINLYASGGSSSSTQGPIPLLQPAVVATGEPVAAPAVEPGMGSAEPNMGSVEPNMGAAEPVTGSGELLTGLAAAEPDLESAAAMPVDGVVPPKLPVAPVGSPGAFIAGTSFTIADPRPPTAALTLTAPNWAKPNAAVPVSVKAASYVGSDVTGANVTLNWDTGKAQGTLLLSTNTSGVASGVINLDALPAANISELGSELTLRATWIGPTREPIMRSKTVRIAGGPVHVELVRTLETDVPGIPFGVMANAYSNDDKSPVTGAVVKVTLTAANDTASLTNCTADQRASLADQQCTIKSGDTSQAAACQLTLPCMGLFELQGCVTVGGTSSCGKGIIVGRNSSWWEASPWSAGPQIQILPDRQNVTVGGDVRLLIQNPWWGPSSGLLVWGNSIKQESRTLTDVPRGVSTISISGIGEECRGSCKVMLVLAVARTAAASAAAAKERGALGILPLIRDFLPFTINITTEPAALPGQAVSQPAGQRPGQTSSSSTLTNIQLPDVPTSKLFDPLAPRTVYAEVTLNGPQPEMLNVDVAVQGQSKTADGTPVLEPKVGKGSISVSVKDDGGTAVAGAEVTLLVVDKAFLDLMPYALQDVSSAVVPDLSTTFSLVDLNAFRTTRGAINATFSTLQRRLTSIDPWLPIDTDVTPRNYYPGDYLMPPAPPAVDVPDSKYLAMYTTPITVLPYRACLFGEVCPVQEGPLMYSVGGSIAMASEAVASDASGAAAPRAAAANTALPVAAAVAKGIEDTVVAGSSQQAATVELRVQGDFKVTALFTTAKTGADGRAVANFTAPDNLGQFVVRAYVAAAKPGNAAAPVDVVYGAAESELLVRRKVSLSASLPRQVRAGDNFTAGVLVELPGVEAETQVTVSASLVTAQGATNTSNPLLLNTPTSVTVTLSPDAPQKEARFNFNALALGKQNISFTAAAGSGGVADRVLLQVPVLGKQGPVLIATSFAVRGSNSSTVANRAEGLELPDAESGSGSISLVAGVGYLPAVQGTYEALIRQGLNGYGDCPTGVNTVALSVIPSLLSQYRAPATPAASYLTQNQINVTLTAADLATSTLTHPRFGLLQQETKCSYPTSPGPDRADIRLNSWAVWLVTQLSPPVAAAAATAGPGRSAAQLDSKLHTAWGTLAAAAKSWQKALETQLVSDAEAARSAQPPGAYDDYDTLSWARLVLGAGWVPTGVSSDVQKDLGMQRLITAVNNASLGLSVGVQARTGLALLGQNKTAGAEVTKITQQLLSNVRVGGRTAYVATGDGDRGAASLSDQSLALQLFIRSGTDNPLIQKIAAWVSQGAAQPPLRFSSLVINTNPWEAALRLQALSGYDAYTNSTTPNIALTAEAATATAASRSDNSTASAAAPKSAQRTQLLSAWFNTTNAGDVVRSSTKWDKVPPNSNLVFNTKGSGEVSVAAALNFTPAELLPFPTYRGLWVQQVIQSSAESGGSLTGFGLGKMVSVAVQVTSPDDQADVVVEVMMPGGLEPLDPNVFKDPDAALICSSSDEESSLEAPSSSSGIGIVSGLKTVAIRGGGVMQMSAGPSESLSFGPNSIMLNSPSSSSSGQYGWWRPWPVCPQQTTSPAVVTFTFTYFRAGTQTVRFQAIAATSGVFVLPPVKAYVRAQPEVMGLSPAGVFTVCPTAAECPAAQQSSSAANSVAKGCSGDCSGNGACDLASGTCICNVGFTADDCSQFGSS